MSELYVKYGRRYRAASPTEVCEAASAYTLAAAAKSRQSLRTPKAAQEFLQHQAGLDTEQFGVIFMDKRHKVIDVRVLFHGTIDGASVHTREIAKHALRLSSAAVIVFHNHPSTDPDPSQADELITQRIKDALALIEVRLVDHLIIGGQAHRVARRKGVGIARHRR